MDLEYIGSQWGYRARTLGMTEDYARQILAQFIIPWYSETGRYYHTLEHIHNCVEKLKTINTLVCPEEVECAIWFHDIIYNTKNNDNEERSANLCGVILEAGKVAQSSINRITRMIRIVLLSWQIMMSNISLISI